MRSPIPFSRFSFIACLLLAVPLILLGFGCASANVNPAAPKAHTGYVDLYADSADGLSWEVERLGPGPDESKVLFSELQPLKERVLRLAFAPGQYKLRVTFLNRVIDELATVEVTVVDGQITPVRIEFADAGSTSVESRQPRIGTTARGRTSRPTSITNRESQIYRLSAAPQAPQPYQTKQLVPYGRNP